MQSDTTLYFIRFILDYNSAACFGPICRAIFRLIFEQVLCTIENAFNYEISFYKNWLK
jgi:hypothetical protein